MRRARASAHDRARHSRARGVLAPEPGAAGRVPIVKMKSFLEYRHFELRDEKERTTVRALPSNWQHIGDFAAHLSILARKIVANYSGEGLASFSLKCLAAFMRADRGSPPPMTASSGMTAPLNLNPISSSDVPLDIATSSTKNSAALTRARASNGAPGSFA